MFNNSIRNSIIRLTLAAKGDFFAAGSRFIYCIETPNSLS